MNARDARALTEAARQGKAIARPLAIVLERIETTTQRGEFSLIDPLHNMAVTIDVQDALWDELRRRGFKVIGHKNPDPGHPCGRDYIEVKW